MSGAASDLSIGSVGSEDGYSSVLVRTPTGRVAFERVRDRLELRDLDREEALHKLGSKPIRREGKSEGRWVLLDFGDIVVHVQHAEDRVYYALERLWKDCPVIDLPVDARGGAGDGERP